MPAVFAEAVRQMKPGDVSNVLRSATGFHIVKLQETRSRNAPTVVEQTHVRHILIKVNEVVSEAEGEGAHRPHPRPHRDRRQVRGPGEAQFGGRDARRRAATSAGSRPGDTVPDFEAAMDKLKIGEVSPPVRTQFGWHLIQVSERRTQDITAERKRDQARMALRQRKSDEAFQDWLRQMRDRAYVEIKPLDQ